MGLRVPYLFVDMERRVRWLIGVWEFSRLKNLNEQ